MALLTKRDARKRYDEFAFKTEPLGKQRDVVRESWSEPMWALLCRPGTGKTKLLLDSAALLRTHDRVRGLLVVAPNEVHHQWVNEGIPTHLAVPWQGGYYDSGMSRTALQRLEWALFGGHDDDGLRVMCISFEGAQTKAGVALVEKFLKRYVMMGAVDESHRCGNPQSSVYKATRPILRRCSYRRIATGTLLRQNPFSAWPQFEMMAPGLLGDSSFSSFKKRYAEMMPAGNWLVRKLQMDFLQKTGKTIDEDGNVIDIKTKEILLHANIPAEAAKIYTPMILAKDEVGAPIFKNLGDLRQRLEHYSSFLTLADVSGKEPRVMPSIRYVKMTTEQTEHYKRLVKYGVADMPGGRLTAEGALALATRLAQCVGGFLPNNDDPVAAPIGDPAKIPKLVAVLDWIEELGIGTKVIIWAKFIPELMAVAAALREKYGKESTVEYHGLKTSKEKAHAKEQFISNPRCAYFVGQQKAAGTGTDGLQAAASYMGFYSNDYPYLEREQAVSRLARTGGAAVVNVVDFMVEGTVDEDIVRCMQAAEDCHIQVLQRRIESV